MVDLLDRCFPDGDHAETALMRMVLVCATISIWFWRKRLRVVLPIAGVTVLLAAITIPSCIPVRSYARRAVCIKNLKRIVEAKAKRASANGRQVSEVPSDQDLFGPGLSMKQKPICPSGGTYSMGNISEKPRCSLEARGHELE